MQNRLYLYGMAALFSFTRKKPTGMLGVGLRSNGVALSHVQQDAGHEPRLVLCEFRACEDPAQHEGILAAALREHRLGGARCVCVLEPGDYNLMLIEAPEVESVELKQAVRWRIRDLIDFHIDDAVVDVFDLPRPRERRSPRLMYVIAARSLKIRHTVRMMANLGLELKAIDIAELALRNVAALTSADANGAAFLELDHQQGLITLTRQGALYLARSVDFSLHRQDTEPSHPHLDSLALELQRSFDYCESHFDLPPPGHLLIAPTEPEPPGLTDSLSETLGLKVEFVDLERLLTCARPIPRSVQARCLLSVGAALRQQAMP